ncbi:hypothetical protein CPB83DRAFT_771677 [Crepidotus variabilis]|uniref:DUF6589 domain-containing protein n=1 Tax=Crepidotus variabilis TaxID=179855 RepID=A0A9P6JMH9_9AGAR|nr:hypothetical protein CPB83DRAFT_771677 [Crepidotus variabilis]
MSEFVLFIHGDLLTKERLDSVRLSRRIEATPKRRFQFVVFLPGLFHFKMACADGIWRDEIKPVESRSDENSLYSHIGILRPKETGKFVSKPGFRRMHDAIHHDIWASILNCWEYEVKTKNTDWYSLDVYAASKPEWEDLVALSEKIVSTYVGTPAMVARLRRKQDEERDQRFENQVLRNRKELLYLELCHAMNAGDIGRVEATFLDWVYIFKATGKHKYASQMLSFMLHLRYVYPENVSKTIRMNWLCNPTGKEFGFRGIDWLVELNNLYTKVIYGGSSSNRTLKRIIDESVLIELFRDCHLTVENGFHLEHRTIRHSPPDMTKTINRLKHFINENRPHVFTPGRKVHHCTPDSVTVGLSEVLKTGMVDTSDVDEEEHEIEGDDLAV